VGQLVGLAEHFCTSESSTERRYEPALLAVRVLAMIRICSTEGGILTLHTATLVLVALLMDLVIACRNPYFMDAACILSQVAFLGILAAACYHGQRARIF